jgi:hypothetical protein
VHGYAAADVLDASAMLTATLSRACLAGRYSYLDRLLAAVTRRTSATTFRSRATTTTGR